MNMSMTSNMTTWERDRNRAGWTGQDKTRQNIDRTHGTTATGMGTFNKDEAATEIGIEIGIGVGMQKRQKSARCCISLGHDALSLNDSVSNSTW